MAIMAGFSTYSSENQNPITDSSISNDPDKAILYAATQYLRAEYETYDRDAVERELSSFMLQNSPIIPGGQYGLTLNFHVILKGNLTKKEWVSLMLAADEDISALNNDPAPSKTYKQDLKRLKASKTAEYEARFEHLAKLFVDYKAHCKGRGLAKKVLKQLKGLNPL
jgi:hypothetical protein